MDTFDNRDQPDKKNKPFGNLIAEVNIPYNKKGKARVGADNLNYNFQKEIKVFSMGCEF
ncbi:hypothetical protein ACIQZD_21965 [Peribacillus sp. NPDC096447]|uniref:hypothetical protein n=1 Tax=Peribacillus sp. NPDC096447 TaxID=3364394 RepID=UPI00380A7898